MRLFIVWSIARSIEGLFRVFLLRLAPEGSAQGDGQALFCNLCLVVNRTIQPFLCTADVRFVFSAASQVLMAASSIFKTKRQEAKAAADAAAAAAADACAVCEKLYGDDPERDETWIACDRCNRWYHGSCVELTQVSVLSFVLSKDNNQLPTRMT